MTDTASDRPFFVIGVHRSGTTMLRFMLNSHPRLYATPESDFIPRFFGRFAQGPLPRQKAVDSIRIIFETYRFVDEWQDDKPDPEAFVDSLPQLTAETLLQTLYSKYASQHGAARWGDKTPIYTTYVDLLTELFAGAQFIHILRDGRDVALSMLDKWGQEEFHIDLYFSARNWVRRIQEARASGAKLGPGLFYELSYESLTENPEAELRAICRFLGESYVPEMAQQHLLAREYIPPDSFSAPVRQPPSTKRVGRWRQEMSQADQRLFQRIAGDMLSDLGYEVVDLGPMSLMEKVRFAAFGIKYWTLQTGRRILQALGVFHPN
jgi:hypothetical protein